MNQLDEITQRWGAVIDRLAEKGTLSPQLMGFLTLVEPKGVLADTLYLEVPNDLTRGMLEQRVRGDILEVLQENALMGGPTNFAVVVNPDIEADPLITETPENVYPIGSAPSLKSEEYPRKTGAVGVLFDTRLNPKYNFDNFVTGGSNRFAHAAAFAVSETPAKAYNPLFIYGGSGLGKTHLLHAIGHYALNLYPKIKVRYVSSEEFTNDFINAIQNNRTSFFQAEYRDIDVLLIDDIQFLQGKDQTQEAFFHTFNTLHDHNKQVVITSDLPPKELTGFEERMLSRFEWGLITDIQAPELETRIAILRKKAENEKIKVPDEILEYMAARVASNIRELEGTLIRVTAFAALNRTPVDMSLVTAVLKDIVPLGDETIIVPNDIIGEVSKYYSISADDLFGSSRQQAVAQARQIAMYFSKNLTKASLANIGAHLGGKDHATVLHACRTVNNLIETDKRFRNYIEDIEKKISIV
jgi:chromosomal replication initiator protein